MYLYEGKKWLFGFCEALACVLGKTQCAICATGTISFFLCGGEKIKNIALVSVSVKMLSSCNSVSMSLVTCQNGLSLFYCLNFRSVCCRCNGRPTIGYNGLQLQEVGDFYYKCSYEEPMFD